ncbi:MAG: hypothetical protein ACR2G7_06905, partial [Acidimicrobiales bacterium]
VLTGLFLLGIGLFGLYWDVAFHIDFGRDDNLFTPSHTMIVLALGGLLVTAGVVVLFATLEHAPVGKRVAGLHVPWSAVLLGALGLGGLVAFPLDNLWHVAFGVDVTLWSPTHLMLVTGGGLAPIALWLMLVEGKPGATPTLPGRIVEVVVLGAILTGLTVYQGEFDFGVPQFQVVYLPVLVAIAAGLALVLARVALGRGGALKAVLAFLVLRGVVALLVGGALNHTVPRFPLYLAAAVAVEATGYSVGTERRLRFAVVSGALVGTVGLAGEIPLVAALHWFPVSAAVLPKAAILSVLAAIAAAVVGAGLSRAQAVGPADAGVAPHPSGRGDVVGTPAVVVGLVALALVLAYPLPREVGPVQALIRLEPVGALANVEVELQPADAAVDASAFGVVAWQGGGRVMAELRQVGPGRYRSSRPVPVTGTWKSMVGLQRGNQVMAAPIYLPADDKIGASAIPALPTRQVAFVRNTDILLREAHGGPTWPATAAYSGLALVVAGWLALFALSVARLSAAPATATSSSSECRVAPGTAPPRAGGRPRSDGLARARH